MSKPFVIDMRHDESADSTYAVAEKWEDALKIAGDFWKDYDGVFDPKGKPMFKLQEDDTTDLDVTIKKGRYFHLSHAGGEGPCITIQKARIAR